MRILSVLLRQRARRDWLQLTLWVAGTAGLATAAVAAVFETFGDEEDRREILAVAVATRTILIFRGTPNGVGDGAFAFFLMFSWIALMGGLMTTFLAVRHTRMEEERGRAELVSATPAGRMLPLAATVIHGLLANAALGALTAAGLTVAGLEPGGSVVFGIALAATGVAFLGIGLLAAQLFRTPRGANGASVAAVLAAYLLRGIGDAAGTPSADLMHVEPAWPALLSPIGYGQLTGAYVENDLTPLIVPVAFGALLVALVFGLQAVRDQGASLVRAGAGRARAGLLLRSSGGLAWRLSLPVLAAWAAGGIATGLLATSLTGAIDQLAGDVPAVVETLQRTIGADASIEEAFVGTFYGMVGILAACCAVQVGLRARQEETHGTADAVLATPVSRVRWLAEYGAVGAIVVIVVLAAAGAAGALGATATDRAESLVPLVIEAAAAQAPAAAVFLGVTLVGVALLPRPITALAWALVGLAAVVGFFGPLFGLPDGVVDLSPFAHSPVPAGGDTDWTGGIWMLGVAAALTAAALAAMRRRELAG
ncbi:ABC transporter permease [Microbacterium sp. JZ31]|uniref:ABC transporter permease n=1 Tax=Microbacterium sp. JZ31 TaxID=1906274 RepID=UPI00193403E6|nr:polyketide antibiotic transporter [Microbacterium sp. JZ31]